jgi:AcrR family transcriptional regulator
MGTTLGKKPAKAGRSYTVSLVHRKARGSGHERLGEILAAAKALFLEHGAENVSTRQIAAQVGISQTALFTYYKTRDEILDRLIHDAFRELGRRLEDVDRVAADLGDWLRRGAAEYVAFGIDHPDEYRLAFVVSKTYKRPANRAESAVPAEQPQIGLSVFLHMEAKVREAMAQGVVRDDLGPSMAVAQVLWASLHGLVALLIARPHFAWEDRDQLIRILIETLLTGMLAKR